MRLNMGKPDRLLRAVIVAPLLVVAAFLVGPGSIVGIILFVLAGVMLATSLVGFCPLYPLVGINTCKRDTHAGGRA